MNAAAGNLITRVLTLQFFVGFVAFVVFVNGAPPLLLLDPLEARGALATTAVVSTLTEILVLFLSYRRLSKVRYVLRALALGSRAFEPEELGDLARVPGYVTRASVGVASAFSALTLVPGLRADGIDFGTALALFVLSLIVVAASALALYVFVRDQVSRAMELAPPDLAGDELSLLEKSDLPRSRVAMQMIAAVVVPVSLVATGAALVAHAHVRAKTAEMRVATTVAVGRMAAAALPGANPLGGRREALRVADEAGYTGRLARVSLPYAVERTPDGSVDVSVPVDDTGISFHLGPSPGYFASPAIVTATLLALLLSVWIGRWLGRALSQDLAVATRHVRTLGNEEVLRGVARVSGDARFRVVTDLARAIEDLTERFREFAAAQERAIEAREQSLRLRGLLFASVSHDLKSPLNAVLGFCALAAAEPLSSSQLESVAIIERRGRELLALIETILDAARAEASRLQLSRARTSVRAVIDGAVLRGDDLGPMDAAPVTVSCPDDLPDVVWDEARMAQAFGALVGHAKRLSPAGGVEIAATAAKDGAIELTVTDPSTSFTVVELGRLLDAQSAPTAPGRHGGLALGLSLARALVGLHGGRLIVDRARGGGAVFRAVIPAEPHVAGEGKK